MSSLMIICRETLMMLPFVVAVMLAFSASLIALCLNSPFSASASRAPNAPIR